MQRLRVGLALLADAVRLGPRLGAQLRRGRLRCLRRSLRDRTGLGARLRQELLDFLLQLLAIALRRLGQLEAFADLRRAYLEGLGHRPPEEPAQEPVQDQELDERHEDPVRIHGERERCALRG